MKNGITAAVTILAVAAFSTAIGAQDKMAKPMAKDKTYTGCIAAGEMAGSYNLTHAMSDMAMGNDAMKKDTMGKDAMAKPMAIESKSVDLSKHVGHKVAVTGSEHAMGMKSDAMAKPMAAWTVTSIKMIAATCEM
jgi:pentapeptide MXKDX repeat protein